MPVTNDDFNKSDEFKWYLFDVLHLSNLSAFYKIVKHIEYFILHFLYCFYQSKATILFGFRFGDCNNDEGMLY